MSPYLHGDNATIQGGLTAIYILMTPNLTLDLCGGRTVSRGGVTFERYDSLKECGEKRNIPYRVLLEASKQHAPGIKANNSVHWEEIQPYLSQHYTELLTASLTHSMGDEGEREVLELRKLRGEVIKLENYNKSKSKDYISRKLVLRTVNTLYGNVFAQLSRYLEHEMPAKCEGMSAQQLKQYNKEFLVRLLSSIKHQETIWKDAGDVETEDKPEANTPNANASQDTSGNL